VARSHKNEGPRDAGLSGNVPVDQTAPGLPARGPPDLQRITATLANRGAPEHGAMATV
jgi:hypothetical protein